MPAHHVMLVAEQLLLRRSLKRLLEGDSNVVVTAEASCGYEALDQFEFTAPDLVLINADLPGLTGFQIGGMLVRQRSATRVAILTTDITEDRLWAALRAGACGLIDTSAAWETNRDAINSLLRGGNLLLQLVRAHPGLTRQAMSRFLDHAAAASINDRNEVAQLLSVREATVLDCLLMGYSTKQIGSELGIAEQTAKNHLHAMMRKLDVHDRIALVRYAVRQSWADLSPRPWSEPPLPLQIGDDAMTNR